MLLAALAVSVLVLSRDVIIFTLQVQHESIYLSCHIEIFICLVRARSEGGDYQDVALSHGNCVDSLN